VAAVLVWRRAVKAPPISLRLPAFRAAPLRRQPRRYRPGPGAPARPAPPSGDPGQAARTRRMCTL